MSNLFITLSEKYLNELLQRQENRIDDLEQESRNKDKVIAELNASIFWRN